MIQSSGVVRRIVGDRTTQAKRKGVFDSLRADPATAVVFQDKQLLGYAKFDSVPVQRTWSVHHLLEPENGPFWEPSKGVMTPTRPG